MTSPEPLIGACCIRDPREPKVWSRTPRNICDQLSLRGRLGGAFWGLPHASKAMMMRALWTAVGYGRPMMARRFLHGRGMRRAHARHMMDRMKESGLRHFLHFAGDRYLPFMDIPAGHKHFFMLDSTWDYWGDSDLPPGYLNAVDRDMGAGYRQMEHIFAVGELARSSLIEHYGIPAERISVVGTGRGIITPFHGPKDYGNGAILFVAKERFEDKGGGLLLEGFRLAREKNPTLQLWLVGDPKLAEAARGLQNVTVYGFLPIEELQSLFERASLFAMPAGREPWGLVYLEAMTCRTPVLGLARGAIPEFTRDGTHGFAIKEASPAAMAETLLTAFSDIPRLEKMGIDGQRYVLERYTWEQVADRILQVIDRGA